MQQILGGTHYISTRYCYSFFAFHMYKWLLQTTCLPLWQQSVCHLDVDLKLIIYRCIQKCYTLNFSKVLSELIHQMDRHYVYCSFTRKIKQIFVLFYKLKHFRSKHLQLFVCPCSSEATLRKSTGQWGIRHMHFSHLSRLCVSSFPNDKTTKIWKCQIKSAIVFQSNIFRSPLIKIFQVSCVECFTGEHSV